MTGLRGRIERAAARIADRGAGPLVVIVANDYRTDAPLSDAESEARAAEIRASGGRPVIVRYVREWRAGVFHEMDRRLNR